MPAPVVPPHAPATEPPPRGFLRRLLLILGPMAVVAAGWWLVDRLLGSAIARECLVAGGLFLTFVGPTVILGPAVVGEHGFDSLSTWGLVGVAAFMTVVTAFFWTYNLDLLERLPRLGPGLTRTRERMTAFLARHPWMRRIATFSVGFFVLLPLPGSGTLGGSLMGRILGLKRRVCFRAVAVGGLAVTLAYGWFGQELHQLAERYQLSTTTKILLGLGLVLVLWLLGKALARLGRAPPSPKP